MIRKGTVTSVAVIVLLAMVVGMSSAALRAAWRNQLVIRQQRSTANLTASIDTIERYIASGGNESGQAQWPIGTQGEQPIATEKASRTIRVTWKPRYDANETEIVAEELWEQTTVNSLRKLVTNE
jgi:hypothetical protein